MLGEWWVWVAGGLAIGVLELLAPGYIFLGFSIGALVTGGLIGFGVFNGSGPAVLVVFAALSLISWAGMRIVLGKRAGNVKIVTRDINDN